MLSEQERDFQPQPDAFYVCVNYGEAVCPKDIREQAICIDGDICMIMDELRK